jgi:glycosyltransferase involved in cell wall biosynthesis
MMVAGLKPKVTIGICGRNCQDTVRDALESVAEQDYPHELMEVVFVDDGSEDNTLKVVEEYLSRTDIVSRIFSGKWRGLGKARNAIVDNSLGDYIIWVDSDMILTKEFVRKQISFIERNPKAGIVTGRFGILPEENLVLTLDLLPSVVEYSRQDWNRLSKMPGTGGATYRVSAAKEVGGFDESIEGTGEDVEIAGRIKQAGWSILRADGLFFEMHGKMSSWKALWKRYVNHGIHNRRLYQKTNAHFTIFRMSPVASLFAGIRYAILSFEITGKKISFIIPVHFTFKMTAWFYGFTKKIS